MSRTTIQALLLAGCLALFAGCGGGESDAPPEQVPPDLGGIVGGGQSIADAPAPAPAAMSGPDGAGDPSQMVPMAAPAAPAAGSDKKPAGSDKKPGT